MAFNYRHSIQALALVSLTALAGCMIPIEAPTPIATTEGVANATSEHSDASAIAQPLQANESVESSEQLTTELLYSVLVASIASQRQQPKVALQALSRAVYVSNNKRLNASAIQLALRINDYQKAIELSRLLLSSEPDNFMIKLAMVEAQIKLNKLPAATATLINLVKAQQVGDEAILQQVATLIAQQQPAALQSLTASLQAANDQNPMLVFTSALLAYRLQQQPQFRALLDRSLALLPAWEAAAMLKLTDMSKHQGQQMSPWALAFLDSYPAAARFRMQYARLLIQQQLYQDALNQLDVVLQQNPLSEDALFGAAVVNMDINRHDLAEKYFRAFIPLSDFADQARLYLAQMYIDQTRYSEAAGLLRIIQASQYYLEAQIALAGIIAKQNNVDAGLGYLRNIDVHGEPESVRLILEQNLLLQDFNQLQRSLELLNQALLERPGQPDLLYNRGLLAAQLNQVALSEQDMRQLIELQPDNAHAYNALGYTLADQTDRYAEAVALISKALQFLPDDAFILDSMGWVQFRIGNHQQAIEYLERAMSIRQDAEIAAHLGEVLWVNGERRRAKKIWTQGIKLDPDNPTLINTIDRLQLQPKNNAAESAGV